MKVQFFLFRLKGIIKNKSCINLFIVINFKGRRNIMKHFKKQLALILAVALISNLFVPTVKSEGLEPASSTPSAISDILSSKTRSTYYTIKKVEAVRNNIKKYEWAKKTKNLAVAQADTYLKLGYDALWNLVTPQSIPRSYSVNQPLGCLNCGKKIDTYGSYSYLADPAKNPWKLECPSCHMKFPTNDFKAYYDSGKDSHGIFNSELADKSLLVNKLYPEKGRNWGVDNGYGYISISGKKYTFIAYYNHWSLWYTGVINRSLNSLRDAYIYTGDIRYARAGIILLDRIADVYPNMDISSYIVANGFYNSDGGANKGKVVGCIWETDLTKDLLKAYDAFYPAIDDYFVIDFLRKKSEEYGLGTLKMTATGIKRNIEDGIVRQIYPAIKNAQIRGNNGMHQSTLALAAIVIDTLPETKEWLDFNFKAGYASKAEVTGGNILATLVNDVDRDGNGNEASPLYNNQWLSKFISVADILDGYDLYPAADLYKNVKFRKMFYGTYQLMLTDLYCALIGDCGSKVAGPNNYLNKSQYIMAFKRFGDPISAQIVYFLNNNRTDDIPKDIFSPYPEMVARDIKKAIDTYGTLKLSSTNLTGYGFGALRDGKAKINFESLSTPGKSTLDTQRTLWMYYGRNQGHGHADTLNIGLNAFKLDLMPELGYPEYADKSAHRTEWLSNTVAHNTVVIDKSKQSSQVISNPKHFDDSDMVKLIDVEAPNVYPQTSLYRRTVSMIKVDNENSYVVDFFRVKGGNNHYYSFHGAEGSVTTENLKLTPQINSKGQYIGTYAGSTIKFGIRPLIDSLPGFWYMGSGFQWLNNVEKENRTGDSFSVDWKIKDTWNTYKKGIGADTDVHLRLTMFGKMDDVALVDGVPPRNKPGNPKNLKYVIAHKQGANLDSLFTSVIEPYKTKRYITSTNSVNLKINGQLVNDNIAKAVKVVLKNGRVDYIINSLDPNATYTVDDKFQFKGFFGVYSEKNGKQVYSYLNDGILIGDHIAGAEAELNGTIEDFTRDMSINNEITIRLDNYDFRDSDLIGKFIYVNNDGIRNGAYQIKGIKKKYGKFVTLDIGDVTLIRSWMDINDFTKGFIYDVAVGAKFTIPLVKTW